MGECMWRRLMLRLLMLRWGDTISKGTMLWVEGMTTRILGREAGILLEGWVPLKWVAFGLRVVSFLSYYFFF